MAKAHVLGPKKLLCIWFVIQYFLNEFYFPQDFGSNLTIIIIISEEPSTGRYNIKKQMEHALVWDVLLMAPF